jgi:tRNA(Ile)-lysidine synthase
VEVNNFPAGTAENNAMLKKLREQLAVHGKNFLCALSGGLDSTVLLHLLARLPGLRVRAIYINHGLHPDADIWSEHCTKFCRELNIELKTVNVEVRKDSGKGTEAAARDARYQAIARHILDDEILLTAHHRQDQAETVLLRLLRGSGSQGLAAMRELTTARGFKQLRPLLSVSKKELQDYASTEKLTWVEDPSNEKTNFDRNFLRHEIMPLLEKRWPHAIAALSRSAELLSEEHQCLREQSAIFLAMVQGVDERALTISGLMQHSKPWRAQILRTWTESLNTSPLPTNILQEIELTLLTASSDTAAQVQWSGTQIIRWRDCLYLLETSVEMPNDWQHVWADALPFTLPNGDEWGFDSGQNTVDLAEAVQKHFGGDLLIGFRQGGEKILLKNREQHSSLKNCLQELGVPPWERSRLPLMFTATGECLALGDVLLSGRFEAFCESNGIRFSRRV